MLLRHRKELVECITSCADARLNRCRTGLVSLNQAENPGGDPESSSDSDLSLSGSEKRRLLQR